MAKGRKTEKEKAFIKLRLSLRRLLIRFLRMVMKRGGVKRAI